jgi:tripartite-type tricarboxylate transporter receptor subunit TctC
MRKAVPPLPRYRPLAGVVAGTLAVAALVSPLTGFAQSYPDKPIRLIVPAGPDGPTDVPARLLSLILPKLGQPAVIENRAGAGGAIGARAVEPGTAAEFAAFIAAQERKWAAVAKAANIRID